MTQLQAILSYQEKDKVLFALEKELHASEARKTSRKMKAFIVEAAEKLDLLETKAKQLKGALKDLEEKCAHAEEALKDFVGLDELVENGGDVAFYKKKALSLQANLKKLTADIQAAMAQVNATHEEYQKLKKQVIVAQKKGKEAQEEYEKIKAERQDERTALETELAVLAKDISPENMERYQKKRKEKIFPVVGKISGNNCPFCRMEVSLSAVEAMKGGKTIECDFCHRIIFGD